jgi:CRP-like cAMP-binding protein
VYAASGSAVWVGVAAIARMLPAFVPIHRVHGLVASCAAVVATVAAVLVVAYEGPIAAGVACAAGGAIGGAAARAAAVTSMLHRGGEDSLAADHAAFQQGRDIGAFAGPALGAVAVWALDATWALGLGAALLAIGGAIAIGAGRGVAPPMDSDRVSSRRQLEQLRPAPFALPLTAIAGAVAATTAAFLVALAVYSQDRLDLGAEGVPLLVASAAVGGVVRVPLTSGAGAARRVRGALLASAGCVAATMLIAAFTRAAPVAVALAAVGGGALVVSEVVVGNTFGRLTAPTATAALRSMVDACSLGGALVAAILLAATSVMTTMVVTAALGLATVAGAALRLGGLDTANTSVLDRLASRIAVLERLPIIAAAPRHVVEQLAAASQLCPLPAGVDVVVEGAPAHAFYAVIDGEVIVHRSGSEIARLGPARHFGERGLIDQAPRNAGVTTAEPSNLLRIEGAVLLGALSSAPTILSALDQSNAAS